MAVMLDRRHNDVCIVWTLMIDRRHNFQSAPPWKVDFNFNAVIYCKTWKQLMYPSQNHNFPPSQYHPSMWNLETICRLKRYFTAQLENVIPIIRSCFIAQLGNIISLSRSCFIAQLGNIIPISRSCPLFTSKALSVILTFLCSTWGSYGPSQVLT